MYGGVDDRGDSDGGIRGAAGYDYEDDDGYEATMSQNVGDSIASAILGPTPQSCKSWNPNDIPEPQQVFTPQITND